MTLLTIVRILTVLLPASCIPVARKRKSYTYLSRNIVMALLKQRWRCSEPDVCHSLSWLVAIMESSMANFNAFLIFRWCHEVQRMASKSSSEADLTVVPYAASSYLFLLSQHSQPRWYSLQRLQIQVIELWYYRKQQICHDGIRQRDNPT